MSDMPISDEPVGVVQPNWIDNVYRGGQEQGEIEVSSFRFLHVANENDDGGYERKLISNMHDAGDDINADVFSAENAATDQGRVRSSFCCPLTSCCFIHRCESDVVVLCPSALLCSPQLCIGVG